MGPRRFYVALSAWLHQRETEGPHARLRRPRASHQPPGASAAPLAGSSLLAVHAVFLGLSALFCSRVFLLTDLDSHAILAGDPALMNWQLQWVSRALYTDPLNLFNGNTFHPHPNVVALTDHMLSLAVINAPLSMLSDSPWFGYNLLIFLAYYLSCVGGYWLMREVTGSHQAGFWAGIFWPSCSSGSIISGTCRCSPSNGCRSSPPP